MSRSTTNSIGQCIIRKRESTPITSVNQTACGFRNRRSLNTNSILLCAIFTGLLHTGLPATAFSQFKIETQSKGLTELLKYCQLETQEQTFIETYTQKNKVTTYTQVKYTYHTKVKNNKEPQLNRHYIRKEYRKHDFGNTLFYVADENNASYEVDVVDAPEFVLSTSPRKNDDSVLFQAYPVYTNKTVIDGYFTYWDPNTHDTWDEPSYTNLRLETGRFESIPIAMLGIPGLTKVYGLENGEVHITVIIPDTSFVILGKNYDHVLMNGITFYDKQKKKIRQIAKMYAKGTGLIYENDQDFVNNTQRRIDLMPANYDLPRDAKAAMAAMQDSVFSILKKGKLVSEDCSIDNSLVGTWMQESSFLKCKRRLIFSSDGTARYYDCEFNVEASHKGYFWRAAKNDLFLYEVEDPFVYPPLTGNFRLNQQKFLRKNNEKTGKPEIWVNGFVYVAQDGQAAFTEQALNRPKLSGKPEAGWEGTWHFDGSFRLPKGYYIFYANGQGAYATEQDYKNPSKMFGMRQTKFSWGVGETAYIGKTLYILFESALEEKVAHFDEKNRKGKTLQTSERSIFSKVK